jgi:hypothetical protein
MLNPYLIAGTTLGDFNQTLTNPRVMQFGYATASETEED